MRADWIRLVIAAARLPLRSDPANNQFDLQGRTLHAAVISYETCHNMTCVRSIQG